MNYKECAMRGLSARRAQAVELGHSDEYLEGFDAAVRALEDMPENSTPLDSVTFDIRVGYPGAEVAVLNLLDPNDPEHFEQVHERVLERAAEEGIAESQCHIRTFVFPRVIGASELSGICKAISAEFPALDEQNRKYALLRSIVEEEYARARENG